MKAPALSPAEARELAELRRRAYGPGDGIGAAELQRLERLEAALHPPLQVEPLRVEPSPVAPPADDPPRAAAPPQVRAEAADEDAPERSLPRRRVHPVWAVALAVAAVAAASAVVLPRVIGPQPDVTLSVVPTEEDTGESARRGGFLNGYGLDVDNITQYQDHRTLTVWSTASPDGRRCLVLDAGSYGPAGISCTPRGLDPSIDFTVWESMPQDIVAGLPPGSVVRFVLSGDAVRVWERAADSAL